MRTLQIEHLRPGMGWVAAGFGPRAVGCENLGFKSGWPPGSAGAQILAGPGPHPSLSGGPRAQFLPGEACVCVCVCVCVVWGAAPLA